MRDLFLDMKFFHFFCSLALTAIIPVASAYAENTCRTEVSYKWKRAQAEADAVEPSITLETRGADEASAKRNLIAQIDREKSRALKSCQERHEDMTGCVAGKLLALEAAMRSMGFSQRKTVEEAVSSDCAARQGKCGEVAVSDIQCAEIVKPSGTPPADEKGGKKDEKGKKK